MEIIAIPAFKDNYIWLLREGRHAAAVDPGDAAPLLQWLDEHDVELDAVLVTHHHRDHAGGLPAIQAVRPCPVYAPADDAIAGTTVALQDGDRVGLPNLGLSFTVLSVPGHTRGHAVYYGAKLLFCGDTLFGCGCGRLFEGTPAQMYESLARISALPPDTLVYCAHEYTQSNIRFALIVEPGNPALRARAEEVDALRRDGRHTVPSTLAEELATNPFLRSTSPEVIASASDHADRPLVTPLEVFTTVREWRDGN